MAAVLTKLLLLFVVLPLVELTLLLWVADLTSPAFTLTLVIGTGIAGALLARSQGWRTSMRIRQELAQGRLPAERLLDAVLIFLAGALLLTPGVLTDALGLSLLIPPLRRRYRSRLIRWLKSRFRIQGGPLDGDFGPGRSEIIDSYVIEDSKGDDRESPSG